MTKYPIKDEEGHEFEKSNLVTQKSRDGLYDIYSCIHCGLKGKRHGLSNFIHAREKKCTNKTLLPPAPPPKFVKTIVGSVCSVGLVLNEVYEVLPAPEEYTHLDGVWVLSELRGTKVRLLPTEYVKVE